MKTHAVPKIAVIGGGAAGMMAAATLLESGKPCEVHLFEKNKGLGAKVIISGGGRCNVTTGLTNRQQLLKKYTRGAEFLKAALSKLPPQKTYEWFEAHGVPLKIEEDLRVFPVSDDGHDIVRIFENLFAPTASSAHTNAHVQLLTAVKAIKKEGEKFVLDTSKGTFTVDAVVITTGGSAYRHTGSTGDGYAFATAMGHTITPLGPSLNSFFVRDDWPKALSGVSLPQALLKYQKVAVTGPLLFTHFGVSGPVTFSLSSQLAYETISPQHPLVIHLIPDAQKSFEDWEAFFIEAFAQQPKKQVSTLLHDHFPKRVVDAFLSLAKIDATKPTGQLSKDERKALSHVLSGALTLTLEQRRPGDEFVTAGGVSTDEINAQTMESLITPGLYFAGEVMNVDGLTGGFNLQASWATGQLAAKSIVKKL